jgi:hypothetical protein
MLTQAEKIIQELITFENEILALNGDPKWFKDTLLTINEDRALYDERVLQIINSYDCRYYDNCRKNRRKKRMRHKKFICGGIKKELMKTKMCKDEVECVLRFL